MKILVDADALPGLIKDILFRAAERTQLPLILFANRAQKIPVSSYISCVVVTDGFNSADDKIVETTEAGDLVITADIPLAARVYEKNGTVISPRGKVYTSSSIRFALAQRNFFQELRNSGVVTDGPPVFTQKDSRLFANALNQFLSKK